MEFRVLGPVEVLDGVAPIDLGGPLERALLSRLLLDAGRTVSIDRLVEDLYPGEPPASAVNSIRVRLSRLRKALGGWEQGPIRTQPPGYVLMLGPEDTLDLSRFEDLTERGRTALRADHAETAARLLREALGLWRGPALAGLGDAPFVRAEATRLEEGALAALEQRIDADLALGRHRDLVGELDALCGQHPLRERFWAQRMIALYRSDRQADALAVFQELRRKLSDELGLDPSPELTALEAQILTQAPELALRPAEPAPPSRPPLPDAGIPSASPFAGREVELAQLGALLKDVSTGILRAVFVAGEPGIGKTRLCSEFARIAYSEGAVVLYGRTDEDTLIPYQPFVEALRGWSAALSPRERASVPGADYLAALVPELARTAHPPPPDEPEMARYKFFEAVASALEHARSSRPLVLILDDLHWADRPTLQLLHHTVRTRGTSPILVVGTYRETDLGRTRPLAEALADFRRERAFERIALHGLAEEEILALLARAAGHEIGGVGRKLARALSRTTEGNPFFIEQIVGHLIDTGRLARREGVWTVDARVEDLGIPEGITEAIGRRLSRLSKSCNAALAAASALGRDFEVDLLTRVLELDPDEVLAAVEEGLQAGLVRERRERRRASCTFSHALVQQVLYEEISLARKQRLHLKAAAAIEVTYADDLEPHVRSLSRHMRQASAAADPEKTIEYSMRAMEAAARAFAFEEAIAHGEAALELIDEHRVGEAHRARLHERLGDIWYGADPKRDRSISHYEAALKEYESRDEPINAAKVQIKLGNHLATETGHNAKALQYLRSAERILGPSPDRRLAGRLALGLGLALSTDGERDAAAEAAERGMAIGRELDNDRWWVAGAAILAGVLTTGGRFDEAAEICDHAWEVADRIDHPTAGYAAAWNRCIGYRRDPHDHVSLALIELEKPRQQQTAMFRLGLRKLAAGALAYAGELERARDLAADFAEMFFQVPGTMFFAGSFSEPESRLDELVAEMRSTGHRWGEGWGTLHLGILRWAAGSIKDARQTLRSGIEIVEGRHPANECETRAWLAVLEAGEGRPEEAAHHIARCEQIIAVGNGWRGYLGLVELARGSAAAARHELGEAEDRFMRSTDLFRRYGLPFDQAEALHLWGRALADAGDRARASERFDAALDIYTRREAGKAWIDRVRAARQRAE